MRIIFLSISLFIGSAAVAQEHSITLQQSKTAALEYSKAIKNGQLNIESAESGKKGAAASYLPSVSVTGVGVYAFKDIIGAPLVPQGINNFYFAGATALQPLYAGGKIATANKLAAMQVEVSRIRARQSKDSVLLQTEQKYWNLVDLQEQHKTLLANEKFLDQVLKQQKDMLASGLIARNDLLKVNVQRSRLLLNKSKLENGQQVARLDFCLYVGIPFDSLLIARDTFNIAGSPAAQPKTGLHRLQEAKPSLDLNENNDYQLLQKSIEAEKLQTRLSKADLLPSIAVGVNAGQAGVIDRGIGSTFMPLAFGTVSIPVSELWGNGKQKVRQREISERIAANNFIDGENKLKVGIMKSWYDLTDAQKQIVFANESIAQATENLKVTNDNYSSGLAGITELMDAQAAYQQALSDGVTSYTNYENKQSSYRYITGKME
ncbi:TolC family protein [Pedobacter sp. AW31-3R]|uniref:TolC family protein n=1 Tax=Pedobacter sp. AW31-3R TaxID=3445781 RepID=UPI003FA11CBF